MRRPAAAKAVATQPPTAAAFKAVTASLFNDTCGTCHNDIELAGGFDIFRYASVDTLSTEREHWEKILAMLTSREMPPPDVARPDAQVNALVKFLEAEFDRADASVAPDPGRVTARRLNRAEYTNTIRDLLAVDFRADRNFPTDDSGDGFDNTATC
jgi:hypothetical protein